MTERLTSTSQQAHQLASHPSSQLARQEAHLQEARLHEEADRFIENAKALNTRKAYRSDWADFSTWCEQHQRVPLPATPETVQLYLTHLARDPLPQTEKRATWATIKRRLSTISMAHKIGGHEENPAASALVATTMQGIKRTLGTAQVQKTPLVTTDLARLVAACDQLLGTSPERAASPLMAARNRALLLLGAAGGFRRSELVALDVADVIETPEGLVVTIRSSKTDQEGRGELVAIPYGSHPQTCPIRTLRAWLRLSGISDGPLWREITRHGTLGAGRLTPDSVARIIKRTCELAGLDPNRYSGHSLRSGMATSAAAGGAPERAIKRQGRWKSDAMVSHYVRHGTIWQECAASYMGL